MKEKIKKIHDKYAAPCKFGITSSDFDLVSQEIEHLVNQEVEKRIAERMPSEEEIEMKLGLFDEHTTDWFDFTNAVYEWLRSRLTSSEKPNNSHNGSQKTEGGEE